MRALALAIGLILAGAGPAAAQPAAARAQAVGDAVARGLEAQFQAALIRERRLADERESRLIADYETQMRDARARFDQGGAGALAELERARAQYAELVAGIALRDSAARAEIEAYRAEAQGLAQRASPELLDAYQRFADGDRLGAWPAIDQLTQAQVRATMAAAGARAAVSVRDAAQARETMRLYGEATAADVLALWDQAAALDPRDFWTQVFRRRLASTLNDLGRAEAAGRAGRLRRPPRALGRAQRTRRRACRPQRPCGGA